MPALLKIGGRTRARPGLAFDNIEMTAHGFRATARAIKVEQLDVEPDVIEAHSSRTASAGR